MVTEPRLRSLVEGAPARGMVTDLVSVNVVQLGPVRQGGSHGLWQHGSRVGSVTGVVPSVGSRDGVVAGDMISPWFEAGIVEFLRLSRWAQSRGVDALLSHVQKLAGWGGEREE
jgi:hypothetical protein